MFTTGYYIQCATIGNAIQEYDSDQHLLNVDETTKKAGLAARIKAKIENMVRVRKGLTVDSGAADHVMPMGWIAWLIVTASLGSVKGLHYIAASGDRIPDAAM